LADSLICAADMAPGSLDSLKTGLQLVALGGASSQCGGEVRDGHARLHCRDEGCNLAVGLAELALQSGVSSGGRQVRVLTHDSGSLTRPLAGHRGLRLEPGAQA